VSCVSSTFCMAVGLSDNNLSAAQTFQPPVASLAEQWDGAAWSVLATPATVTNPQLATVSCASPTFCVAVGKTNSLGEAGYGRLYPGTASRALVEMWNGATWTVTATPAGSVSRSGLSGVTCTSVTFCVAVGVHSVGNSGEAALAEMWNGSAWQAQKI